MAQRKKDFITVTEPPPLKRGKLYPGRILAITKDKKSVRVRIENLDAFHVGRVHEAELPLAVWPGNRTSQFFGAAGIDANRPGEKISVDDCIGRTVGMRFDAPDEDITAITFEPLPTKRPRSRDDSEKEQAD